MSTSTIDSSTLVSIASGSLMNTILLISIVFNCAGVNLLFLISNMSYGVKSPYFEEMTMILEKI